MTQWVIDTSFAEERLALGMSICLNDLKKDLKSAEVNLIRIALGQSSGNVAWASRLLGINRTALHEKISRYEI